VHPTFDDEASKVLKKLAAMSGCKKFRSGPNADKFLKCLANVLTVLIETYSPQFCRRKDFVQEAE
jgi:hypothetical protein